MAFDTTLFQAIHNLAGRFGALDIVGIFAARYLPYLLVIAFVVFLVLIKNWRVRFYAFALAALSSILARGILAEAIRLFYARPRPPAVLSFDALIPTPTSSSFPSGHATFFFALALAVFFVNRKWGIWFLVLATVVSVARVFVGVHWPMDIVGGALLGIASAFVVRLILPKPNPEPVTPTPTNFS